MKILRHLILCCALIAPYTSIAQSPVISIITSVYNGDEFIEGFMRDITQQTIFNQCELIMINANSSGNEEAVIKHYMAIYPNITYRKLNKDPGIYSVWNMAIDMAQGEFLTNANLDDRLRFDCYENHLKTLQENPDIDLVYSDFYFTRYPNETFASTRYSFVHTFAEFSKKNMEECLPNNHPMWRKSFHQKYGLFDGTYKHVGDYEMWLRAVAQGTRFKKVQGVYGLYYYNPKGLSSNSSNPLLDKEDSALRKKYSYLFTEYTENTKN